MVRFSHDDRQIPFVGVIPNEGLNPCHPGAGGINDFQSGVLEKLPFLRGDAVSADDQGSLLERGDVLCYPDPFGLKELHDLFVVNERAVSEDGPGFFVGLSQHLFKGAANSHAKACGFGLLDLHEISASSSEK
jgi:hypothetical protein